LRNSRIPEKSQLEDLLPNKERQLDLELISNLGELHFIDGHLNLIFWGAPGTGKTWLAEALATRVCHARVKCRWISFPVLSRDLEHKQQEGNKALDSRLFYYAKFPLLCIDEFPNVKMKNGFFVQELFDLRCTASRKNSTMICAQSSPENWPQLFPISSFGESVRGRLEEHGKVIQMKESDLRCFKDPQ